MIRNTRSAGKTPRQHGNVTRWEAVAAILWFLDIYLSSVLVIGGGASEPEGHILERASKPYIYPYSLLQKQARLENYYLWDGMSPPEPGLFLSPVCFAHESGIIINGCWTLPTLYLSYITHTRYRPPTSTVKPAVQTRAFLRSIVQFTALPLWEQNVRNFRVRFRYEHTYTAVPTLAGTISTIWSLM